MSIDVASDAMQGYAGQTRHLTSATTPNTAKALQHHEPVLFIYMLHRGASLDSAYAARRT